MLGFFRVLLDIFLVNRGVFLRWCKKIGKGAQMSLYVGERLKVDRDFLPGLFTWIKGVPD